MSYTDDLGRTAYEAMLQTTGGGWAYGRPWRTNLARDAEMVDVAEAVAAKVLRDVCLHMDKAGEGLRAFDGTVTPRSWEVREFAAEHGIDLTEPQP